MKYTAVISLVASPLFSYLSLVFVGAQNEGVVPRNLIYGGRTVDAGEVYDWFVAGNGRAPCGGTLIYKDIVLTAAHCIVEGAFDAGGNVQIGGTDAPKFGDFSDVDGEVVGIDLSDTHPCYLDSILLNDIALVKLSSPSSKSVIEVNYDPTLPVNYTAVTAIGYGEDETGNSPDRLKVLYPAYVQPQNVCREFDLNATADTVLCVSDDDPVTSVCFGDSGGPIFTNNRVQVGIGSYVQRLGDVANGICDGSKPSYFTNVAFYEQYIKNGICRLSADPPTDCANLPSAPTGCTVTPPSPPITPISPVVPVPTPSAYPPPSTEGMMQEMSGKGKGKGVAPSPLPNAPIPPTSTGGVMEGMSGKGSGKGKGPSPPPYTPIPPTDTGGMTEGMSGKGSGGKGKGEGGKSGMAKSSKDPPKAPKMKKSMMGDSSVRNRYLT